MIENIARRALEARTHGYINLAMGEKQAQGIADALSRLHCPVKVSVGRTGEESLSFDGTLREVASVLSELVKELEQRAGAERESALVVALTTREDEK